MAVEPVEGNQQANGSEDKLNDVSGRIDDGSNVDGGVSSLENGRPAKENQGSNTSELNSALVPGENSIYAYERNYALMDAEKDTSGKEQCSHDDEMKNGITEMLSPINGEAVDADIDTNVARNETAEFDASQMISPLNGENCGAAVGTIVVRDELGNSVSPKMNSPSKKCTSVVDEILMDAENSEEKTESRRLSDLRERKKSKYLSPPYLNLIKGSKGLKEFFMVNYDFLGGGEDSNYGPNLRSSSPFTSRSGSKRKAKKWPRKSVESVGLTGTLQEITASSGQLLSELRLIASDCCHYPLENKHFEPTEIFFTTFRSYVFRGECNAEGDSKVTDGQNEKELVNLRVGDSDDCKPEPKKRRRKEKFSIGSTNLVDGLYDIKVDVASTPPISVEPLRKVRKMDIVTVTALVSEVAKETTPISLDFSQEDKQIKPSSSNISKKSKKTVNTNKLVVGSQIEGSFVDGDEPNLKRRLRKCTDIAKAKSDGNPEEKKRQRRRKDGTYPDDLTNVVTKVDSPISSNNTINAKNRRRKRKDGTYPNGLANVDTPISSNDTINAKPILLEVCLENVGPNPLAEESPLAEIRQKLEVMTTMLRKSGDKLTHDMKVVLENEIRELLQKVSTMPSSS